MSHRDTCPDRWDAEREGRRAQEYGYGSWRNPYEDRYGNERACDEAADAWRSGYRRAEMIEEEQREEEAAQARAARHRAEMQAEEEYAYEIQAQQERLYYEEQERARYESQESSDAVDPQDGSTTE